MKCNKKALILVIVCAWVQSYSFQRSEWPRWSGPTDRLIATSKGIELIDDYQQAREVWRSERIPTAHGNYGGDHTNKLPSSGGASPILYNGKVYFNYYAPSPDSKKGEEMNYRVEKQPEWSKRILADEVILCLDMADGRTLWKKVFKEKGINIQDMKSPGRIHFTPVAIDGKIYALGTMARLYCVDANTGDLVWESQIPGYFEQCERIVSEALADGKIVEDVPVGGRRTGNNLNFVKALDHVIVTIGDDIFAYNGSTGDLVWKKTDHTGLIGPHAHPVEWKGSDGNYYLLCAGRMGLVCLDAGDGSVQWELPGGMNDVNCYIDGDVVVFCRDHVDSYLYGDGLNMLQGYRLKVDGPELLWAHSDTALGYKIHYQGVAKDGYLYYPLFRAKRPEGSTEKPPRNDSSVCILMETGEHVKTAYAAGWSQSIFMSAEDRLFHCRDFSHTRQEFFFMHPGPDFRMMGGIWEPAHAQTTSKHNAALMTPYADGYIYIRTALGIHCYDIRKNPPRIEITSPQHNSELPSGPLTLNCTIAPGESAVSTSVIYVNGIKREERQGAINSWTLPDLAAGVHHIRIDIEDDKTISSDWVVISIGDESQKITGFPFKVDLGSTLDRSIGAPMPGFPADKMWVPGAAYGYVENEGRFITEAIHEDKSDKPYFYNSWVRMGSLYNDTPLRYRIRLDGGDYYFGFTYFSGETNDVTINGQTPSLESKSWSITPEYSPAAGGPGDPNIQFPMTITPEPVALSSGINEISFSGAVSGFIIDTKPVETIDVAVHAGDRGVMFGHQEDISFSIRNNMLYISGRANAPVEITLFNVCGRRMGHWRLPANRKHGMIATPMAKGAYFATVKAESRTIHRLIHSR